MRFVESGVWDIFKLSYLVQKFINAGYKKKQAI